MGKPLSIFSGTVGLNNVVDPKRLLYDPDTKMQELAAAYNVDIDDTGRPSRRKGFSKVVYRNAHSLFSWGGAYALFVTGDALAILDSDFSCIPIRNVTVGARMSYAEAAGTVYYANGYEKGLVRNRLSYDWEDQDYVGPATYKVFTNPLIGHLIEIWNGRSLVAVDDVIWYSEPFAYGRFRLAANYIPLSGRIRLMRGVKGGVYASDDKAIYFLPGNDMVGLGSIKKADYPAIEGTDKMIEGSKIGSGELQDRCVVFASTKGICIGGPEGYFKNVTERKLTYPTAIRGTGYNLGNRYVCTLEP